MLLRILRCVLIGKSASTRLRPKASLDETLNVYGKLNLYKHVGNDQVQPLPFHLIHLLADLFVAKSRLRDH